jgi:predicted alpha/beta superfamily hydrolase
MTLDETGLEAIEAEESSAELEKLDGAETPAKTPAELPDGLPGERLKGEHYTGHCRLIKAFPSQRLDQPRDLYLYLPPGYNDAGNTERYPVLYIHDGNNLFNPELAFGGYDWKVDETAERLITGGELRPMIIVGVANTPDRMDEYTWTTGTAGDMYCGGAGALYARFLIEELKTYIDREFRTLPDRENTGVAGSSLGGLISMYIGMHFNDVFKRVGILSPSLHWSRQAALYTGRRMPRDLHIWLDMGWREDGEGRPPQVIRETRALRQILDDKGYEVGKNLAYFEDPRGTHSEYYWAKRMPTILKFLFGPPAAPAL